MAVTGSEVDLIAQYPIAAKGLIVLMGIIIVKMYRDGKKHEKSELLNEVSKVASSIERMTEEIRCLFKKDRQKEERVDKLEQEINAVKTRCNEREKHCPGMPGNCHQHRRATD